MVLLFFVIQQTFGNSSASLRNIEERVNSSFDIATANLTEIEDTFRESEELLEDVTEAQGRLPLCFI